MKCREWQLLLGDWDLIGSSIKNGIYSTTNEIRGAYNKFPDFFRMGTFIDSTHMKL